MSKVPATLSGKARIWNGPIPGSHEAGFVEQPIIERPVPPEVRKVVSPDKTQLHNFQMGECRILLGLEPQGVNGELRWHMSISCVDRHPTWDEIKTARYRLLGPDTVMAMILPPAKDYVNVPQQDHVFQVWEIRDDGRIWE